MKKDTVRFSTMWTNKMTTFSCIMACKCGVETECEAEDQRLAHIWQCPACKVVMAAVLSRGGRKEWITVDPAEVKFKGLLREYSDDGERMIVDEDGNPCDEPA